MSTTMVRITSKAKKYLEELAELNNISQVKALEESLEAQLKAVKKKAFWDSMLNRKPEDIEHGLEIAKEWETIEIWD